MARQIETPADRQFRETEWSRLEARRSGGRTSSLWIGLIDEVEKHARWMLTTGLFAILAVVITLYHWPVLIPIGFGLVLAGFLGTGFLLVLNLAKLRDLDQRQTAISQAMLGVDEREGGDIE